MDSVKNEINVFDCGECGRSFLQISDFDLVVLYHFAKDLLDHSYIVFFMPEYYDLFKRLGSVLAQIFEEVQDDI